MIGRVLNYFLLAVFGLCMLLALFDVMVIRMDSIRGFIIFSLIVLVICSIPIWVIASNNGMGGFGWFLLSIETSPILVGIILGIKISIRNRARARMKEQIELQDRLIRKLQEEKLGTS